MDVVRCCKYGRLGCFLLGGAEGTIDLISVSGGNELEAVPRPYLYASASSSTSSSSL